jgi:hypothetical protein
MENQLKIKNEYLKWFEVTSARMLYLVIIMAIFVLIGWQFDIQTFKSVFQGIGNMNPTTALLIIMLMVSLKMLMMKSKNAYFNIAAQTLAWLVIVFGALTILRYILNIDLGIDQLIFRDKVIASYEFGDNRQAPTTALNFILLGAAILLLFRRSINNAQLLSFITTMIALMSIIGYLYSIEDIQGYFGYTQMTFNAALCFFFGSLAISFSNVTGGNISLMAKDSLSGKLLRIFLPIIIFATILIGLLVGYVRKLGVYNAEFGMALFTLVIITFFLFITFIIAMNLDKSEEHNLKIEDDLNKQNEELENLANEMKSKVEELERLNRLMVGRELKMMELKEKLKNLEKKA